MFTKGIDEKSSLGAFSCQNDEVGARLAAHCAMTSAVCGEAAHLDLINGHLGTVASDYDHSIPFGSDFTPLVHSFIEFGGWKKRVGSEIKDYNLVAKIQPFHSGGYEVTLSWLSIPDLVKRLEAPRVATGKRVLLDEQEQSESDIARSLQRAAKNTRLRIKSMGCDRLLTLTRRESNLATFWRLDDWKAAWKRFIRLCAQAGASLSYVAVPEKHQKGNYHLHAAIVGKVSINVLRRCWWACCGGRGQGNVDIAFKRNVTDYKRRAGVAKYVSKYIGKQKGIALFNKKRYWSSTHALPSPRRYVLDGSHVYEALIELAGILHLDINAVLDKKLVWVFPNLSGAWFNYDERLDAPIPF